MAFLACRGTHVSALTIKLRLLPGVPETTNALSSTLSLRLSYFHSFVTATRIPKHTLEYSSAKSSIVGGGRMDLSLPPRWSCLQQYRTAITAHSMKRPTQKISKVATERVYTSVTKRHLLQSKPRRSNFTAGQGPSYTIPTSSLIRSNTMIRSPYTILSLTHYYSDGSGGPSRFPQVNPPNRSTSSRWAQGVGILGAASVLFGKTKYVLAALKVTKLASLGSMVLSIGAYSMLFGWPYAIGVVGLIFCHECGHLAVMLNRGIPFSPMVFIPFVGAVVAMKDQPRDAWEDALIAAGGPLAGTMASCAVAVAANFTNAQILYALADFGYMINLVNLLPIGSMDGGRWVGALSKYVGACGTAFGGYLAWTGAFSNPIFYLIVLAGAYETFWRFYDPYYLPPNFYKISNTQRALLTGGYFGLIAFLVTAMAANNRRQKPPEVIAREQGGEPFWDSSSF